MHYLEVPYFKQDTGYTCGPASLQMVFGFYGIHESEGRLTEELKPDEDNGTDHQAMIDLVLERGFNCYVNDRSTLQEVEYLLKYRVPVVVQYIESSHDEDHYSVVIGLTDASIVLNDPWNGERLHISHKNFLDRWKSKKIGDTHQWLMAVTQEPLPLGKQYHPHSA